MRLLLTRAPDDAARTRAKLEAMGHEVMLAPVLEIVPLPVRWPAGVVDAVVATSGHAFAALLPAEPPSAEVRRLVPLYLVGARTAAQAHVAGFRGAATVATSAAALVPHLADPAGRCAAGRCVVFLAGRDRKPDVENALSAANGRAVVLESYEARAAEALPTPVRAVLGEMDGVLHFSQRSAERFAALSAAMPPSKARHYCLSPDVAIPLHAAGFTAIEISASPDEHALLALLERAQA